MTIADAYTRYHIMPNLQLHMYRVAAVAQLVCDHFSSAIDTENIVLAALLHDMGNIIKFDHLEPEWQTVQDHFRHKYGMNEYVATLAIVRELGVPDRVWQLVEAVNFDRFNENFTTGDFGFKIAEYADNRVAPWGVVSLQQRCDDLEKRYGAKYPSEEHKKKRAEFRKIAGHIEQQIFEKCQLRPEEITEEKIQPLLRTLPATELI